MQDSRRAGNLFELLIIAEGVVWGRERELW